MLWEQGNLFYLWALWPGKPASQWPRPVDVQGANFNLGLLWFSEANGKQWAYYCVSWHVGDFFAFGKHGTPEEEAAHGDFVSGKSWRDGVNDSNQGWLRSVMFHKFYLIYAVSTILQMGNWRQNEDPRAAKWRSLSLCPAKSAPEGWVTGIFLGKDIWYLGLDLEGKN